MPFYVPKFHSGWEPPLDVLQEAPWEAEGLAPAPTDEVRAPSAHPRATGWPLHGRPLPSPLRQSALPPALLARSPPRTKPRWPTIPAASSSEPPVLSKLLEAHPGT